MDDFWVLNFSNRSIVIKDLNLIVAAHSMYNLLNKKYFNYDKKRLLKSLYFGSIYLKRDRVTISQREPEFYNDCMVTVLEEPMTQELTEILKNEK